MRRWSAVGKAAQAFAAHSFLFSFTLLLALKIDRRVSFSWWLIFLPILLFHSTVARGRFSLPAPSSTHDRHWAPCHAILATPLLIAFELLLCVYLESTFVHGDPAVNLKIVFLPLILFEAAILVDNFRMCVSLMPADEERASDENIWETLPHFWVAIAMIFFVAATTFTLLKLCGEVGSLDWWDLFINFGIAECFAFLVCTKWTNPAIHQHSNTFESGFFSTNFQQSSESSSSLDGCQLQLGDLEDIGGNIMKIPFIIFQIMLCIRLEGTPHFAKDIPILALFLPLFLLQGAGVLLSTSRLIERIILLRYESFADGYLAISSRAYDCFSFLFRGSRVLGWWSIDDESLEERVHLFHAESTGYNTFRGCPPEVVKNMPRKDLAQEISRLQETLHEQSEITKSKQQEYEKLLNEKVLCRICFEREICIILLPCRHRTLCKVCSEKCKRCPICRVTVEERMVLVDV